MYKNQLVKVSAYFKASLTRKWWKCIKIVCIHFQHGISSSRWQKLIFEMNLLIYIMDV